MMRRFFLGIVIALLMTSAAQAKMVSIVGKKVNMRSGPGERYAVLWELGKGFPLRALKEKTGWVKVEDFEGDVGWVYKKLTGRTPYLIVKKKRVNIRSGAGTKYKIVGKADYGVVFKTLERGRGWVKVRHENGLTGWVKRNLLWGW